MNIEKRLKDAAVSPVVGVLLMLVITIIIAAVVSGFAGGLVENKPKTPQVSLDVTINGVAEGDEDGMTITIEHLSGDPINTRQTELITSWTFLDYSAAGPGSPPDVTVYYAKTEPVDTVKFDGGLSNSGLIHQPFLVTNDFNLYPTDDRVSWGHYIMTAGDVARVDGSLGGAYELGSVINNFDKLTRDDIVTVRLIDSVTGGSIYEKDISPVFSALRNY